jgi:hypothetical protein
MMEAMIILVVLDVMVFRMVGNVFKEILKVLLFALDSRFVEMDS